MHVTLKKDHTRDFKKEITSWILEKDQSQDFQKGSHSRLFAETFEYKTT